MRIRPGRCLSMSWVSSAWVVGKVAKRWSSAERYRQATLLYLPRSMARMVPAAVVVVVIGRVPVGRVGTGIVVTSRLPLPHGLHGFFRPPEGFPIGDEEKFLSILRAAPRDTLTRSVDADWLEEQGQPERAEFLRLQAAGMALPPEPARSGAARQRFRAVRRGQDVGWLRSVEPL